jgi:hypothetical protein
VFEDDTYVSRELPDTVCSVKDLIKLYAVTIYRAVEVYSSSILNLGTRLSWVVSFTILPLYPPRKLHKVPIE